MPNLADLQPYMSALTTVLSAAILGVVINASKMMSDAAKAKAEVTEERLKNTQEDLKRTETWAAREKENLTTEINKLNQKLTSSLSDAGFSPDVLASGNTPKNLTVELREIVERTVVRMEEAISTLQAKEPENEHSVAPDWQFEIARGYMATHQWDKAASELDAYVLQRPYDWRAQMYRGVSHTNSRKGEPANLSALRAYNEALTSGYGHYNSDLEARLHSYRGAVFKRLNRLDEAETDLDFALRRAQSSRELLDIKYNLACVYAMKGDREKLLLTLHELRQIEGHRLIFRSIRLHIQDYFKKYKDDTEFLSQLKT